MLSKTSTILMIEGLAFDSCDVFERLLLARGRLAMAVRVAYCHLVECPNLCSVGF